MLHQPKQLAGADRREAPGGGYGGVQGGGALEF